MEREMNLKSMVVEVNVGADLKGLSSMQLVFDANRPTELLNGLTQAIHDIEVSLKNVGILTKQGVGTGEMVEYVEYMKELAEDAEQGIKKLYLVMNEIKNSDLVYKYVIEDMIQEKIDEAWVVVDEYYEMVDEVQVVEATEFDMNRPQTIVEDVIDEATE